MTGITLEVIAVTVADAAAAESGGADRIELVADLPIGGTTPAVDVIRDVKRVVSIPVYVMIRPRGGDFVYSEAEISTMVEQARTAVKAGADGIVTGALRADGTIDCEAVTRVVEAARVPATFHKAFDRLPPAEMLQALGRLIDIPRVERLLTAGGAGSVWDGRHVIAELVDRSELSIMPGGGVTLDNVVELVEQTGVREIHVGTAVRQPPIPTGSVSETLVGDLRQILQSIG